jgi:predicted Zn-dependent protease
MHEAELSADYFGVQYLYKSGYDPKCYTDFVQRIWSGMPASAPFTTYPPLSKRLKALQKEVVEILPKRDGAITSTPEFQEFRNHLQAKKMKLARQVRPAVTDPLSSITPGLSRTRTSGFWLIPHLRDTALPELSAFYGCPRTPVSS